jgi:hypothetical protein
MHGNRSKPIPKPHARRRADLTKLIDKTILNLAAGWMFVKHWRAVAKFRRTIGRLPRLCPPSHKPDKFFWRKVFDRNPLFEIFCDKLACKEWVREKCPDLAIPRTLWQGDSAREIPDEILAGIAIVKANAASARNVMLDGQTVDRIHLERQFEKWLSKPFGRSNAEWGYRNAARRVFVEEVIAGPKGEAPVMIEVYTMAGKPICFYCIIGQPNEPRYDGFFAPDGKRLPRQVQGFEPISDDWRPPNGFRKALRFAQILGQGIDSIRCDFLCISDDVWFGEMTPYSGGGLSVYADPSDNEGAYVHWDIRQSWFLTTPQTGWKALYAAALTRVLKAG